MAVRTIRIWPDPALKEIAAPVTEVNDEIRQLVTDLFETMYEERGIGLAATQVAVAQRVLVIDLDPKAEGKDDPELAADLKAMGFSGPRALINPKIVSSEGEILWEEGCLSVPGITETVKRREQVVVEALDQDGNTFSMEASDLYAVALQHEMDHLDGKVFVEYLSKIKRDVIRRKMERLKVEGIDDGEAISSVV